MECYSAIKRKGLLTHAMPQMNLKNIKLSEMSQPQKTTHCTLHLPELQISGCLGWGRELKTAMRDLMGACLKCSKTDLW